MRRQISVSAFLEDTLCHEFAALALSSMAADYSSKVAICDNEGMEALIRGLSENDPDVQKNSVEAIGLLLLVRSFQTEFYK